MISLQTHTTSHLELIHAGKHLLIEYEDSQSVIMEGNYWDMMLAYSVLFH